MAWRRTKWELGKKVGELPLWLITLSLEQVHVWEDCDLPPSYVTSPGLGLSPRLSKCQLSQQLCCSEVVQASVLQLKTFVFLSPRLKVENGRESVPLSQWQARIMTKKQFTMRTFFHCKNLIAQTPNFSLEMALQSIRRNVWPKWARKKKMYIPSHHCLSEQGFKDAIFF